MNLLYILCVFSSGIYGATVATTVQTVPPFETALTEFLITAPRNDFAPKNVTGLVTVKPDLSIGQLVVAWQDMPFSIFVQDPHVPDVNDPVQIELGFFSHKQLQWFLDHLIPSKADQKKFYTAYSKNTESLPTGGGTASGGYHALKNGLLLSQLASAPQGQYATIGAQATQIPLALSLFGLKGDNVTKIIFGKKGNYTRAWRQTMLDLEVIEKKSGTSHILADSNGDWLTAEGLQALWDKIPAITPHTTLTINTNNLPLLCILSPQNSSQADQPGYAAAIAKAQQGATVAFIVPVDTSAHPRNIASRTHWISVVSVMKDTHRYVLIADSKNTIRYTEPAVLALIKDLCGGKDDFDATIKALLGTIPSKNVIIHERNLARALELARNDTTH